MASFHHRIKSGKKGTAKDHVDYITRQGKYANRDDLIYVESGNLPDWAEGTATKFFKASDTYERANGASYREHVIALPNELDMEQNCTLARQLARELVGNKAHVLAVHAPEGKLGRISNPHVHLTYSDRVQDSINRPMDKTFARYNAVHPEAGGCRKDSGGKNALALRNEVIATRKKIADILNEALATHGHDARVDHRSHRERGIERQPERHLGPARIKHMSEDDKTIHVARRSRNASNPQPA
jgi:hypothetical protein